MGQTIICEYLAVWDETGEQPDVKAFGWDNLRAMLDECQETMFSLGNSTNEWQRKNSEVVAALQALGADKQRVEVAQYKRIAELEAELRRVANVAEANFHRLTEFDPQRPYWHGQYHLAMTLLSRISNSKND